MSKVRHGKSTFFIVMMTLLVCGVLAIGATYAFDAYEPRGGTDDPAVTLAPADDYSLDLSRYNKATNSYISLLGKTVSTVDVNSTPVPIFESNTLWEPGKTEIVYLKIENNEAFDMDCRVVLNVTESTFGDNLEYAVINDLKANDANQPTSWSDFSAKAIGKGTLGVTDTSKPWDCNVLYEVKGLGKVSDDQTTSVKEKYFALAIHMKENAKQTFGSDGKPVAMSLSMEFAVKIDADLKPGTTPTPVPQNN